MKVEDTIIITDPCYVVKDEDWDKCEYGKRLDVLGFTNYVSESTIYGDWSCTTYSTPRKDVENQIEELFKLDADRWDSFREYGEDSAQVKIYDDKIAEASVGLKEIGRFCADAGMVCVLSLSEVVKYDPELPKWIATHPRCVTVIPDFDGVIDYYVDSNEEAHIYGIGNVNFYTTQTGL